jgi:hypothetical protein
MTKTEQRSIARVEVQTCAVLQALGASSNTNGPATRATVVDASDRGMRLRAAIPMNAGQAVTVEIGESMFLGEVCYCTPAPGGEDKSFHLGIVTRECLTGLASLHHLIQALTPEPARELQRRR